MILLSANIPEFSEHKILNSTILLFLKKKKNILNMYQVNINFYVCSTKIPLSSFCKGSLEVIIINM